jgi:hypothetical protein
MFTRWCCLLVLSACIDSGKGKDDSGDSASGSGGSDGGSGGGSDGGGSDGGGSDGGGSDGGGGDLDCEAPPEPEDYDSGCVTQTLSCGDTVVSTTEGGSTSLDGSQYSSFWACAVVGTESYQGPERMFEFYHPGTGNVTFTLETPCDDLDLFAMRWEESSSCPREGVSVLECDGEIGGGSSHDVVVWNNESGEGWRYLIIVEGPAGEEAPFSLSVDCP